MANPVLDDALRQGWEAYGRGDIPAAYRHAPRAHVLAPKDPQVRMLLNRLAKTPSFVHVFRSETVGALALVPALCGAVTARIVRFSHRHKG